MKQHLPQFKPAGALSLSKTGFEPGKRYFGRCGFLGVGLMLTH